MAARWDIFCKVIDNFGDIGVAWRLARALAREHGLDVRLWVDDLAALARIRPGVSPMLPAQRASGVDIRRWGEPFPSADPGDVVVETFQCALPQSYVVAMAARPRPPCWINLDYLSAEPWVQGCHRLPSPHPRLPLTKYFYFPGFDAGTGGLLRERDLEARRAAFVRDREALQAYWSRHGLATPALGELRVSLFCYPQAPLAELLEVWSHAAVPVTALMPDGPAAERLRSAFAADFGPHGWLERGSARLKIVPFTDQDDYDRLLWACDVNFVRGEDSFVRAQWARRAFVWNIYPQSENAHWIKLNAFLDRFGAGLDAAGAEALRQFWRAWNGIAHPDVLARAWVGFVAQRERISQHADRWAAALHAQQGLASGLVDFCEHVGQLRVN